MSLNEDGVSTRQQLIEGLRHGIDSKDWAQWAKSRVSLTNRIGRLRREGFDIEAVSMGSTPKGGKPRQMHRLIKEKAR